MRFVSLSALLVALAACSSTTTTDAAANDATTNDAPMDAGSDPMAACTTIATSRCAKIDQCSNGLGVTRAYGSMDVCVSRQTANCLGTLMAPMTTATSAFETACAAAITAESCADYRSGITPVACIAPPGPLANGMPCVAFGQCQSTVCLVPRNGQCGVCAPQPVAGDDCSVISGCDRDLFCNHNITTGSYTCRALVPMGGTCDIDHPCGADLGCVRASGTAASGTCQPLGTSVGAACNDLNVGMATCDANQGLFCNGTSQCAMTTTAAAGAACGPMSMRSSDAVCTGGASCPTVTAGTARTCLAPAMDGQPCDTSAGPGCIAPSRCVLSASGADAGTMGTCQVFNPTACH